MFNDNTERDQASKEDLTSNYDLAIIVQNETQINQTNYDVAESLQQARQQIAEINTSARS